MAEHAGKWHGHIASPRNGISMTNSASHDAYQRFVTSWCCKLEFLHLKWSVFFFNYQCTNLHRSPPLGLEAPHRKLEPFNHRTLPLCFGSRVGPERLDVKERSDTLGDHAGYSRDEFE